MHAKQIDNLLAYSPEERVDYFIRYCADFDEVWGLAVADDQWVIYKDKDGDEIFPLWPNRKLAEICMFDEHKKLNAQPQSIPLANFLSEFVPDMIKQGVSFGIFFDKKREGYILHPNALKKALEEELENFLL